MLIVRHIITFSDWLSKVLMVLAAFWALGLSFLIVADIIGNNVVGRAIPGVRELVITSIVMIVYLQLGYAIRSHCMLRADSFLMAMPLPVRRVMLAIGYALGAVFFTIVLLGTIDPALWAWRTGEFWGEGALRVPVWPARFMIIFGCALAILNYFVAALIDVLELEDVPPPTIQAEDPTRTGHV
jgi:TRAP-type C4-dicarboxylate transport system permease small subunit